MLGVRKADKHPQPGENNEVETELFASMSALPVSLRAFLYDQFRSADDLARAPILATQLSAECDSLENCLSQLHSALMLKIASWSSYSQLLCSSLGAVSSKVDGLKSPTIPIRDASITNVSSPASTQQDLLGKLPLLAEEVARVEGARRYAETALRLEALVGDLEDAVAAVLKGVPRISLPLKFVDSPPRKGKLSAAVNALQATEDVVAQTTKSRPQWKRLLLAVENRVDRALATLRPCAIADHRALLTTLKWPPPLSSVRGREDRGGGMRLDNAFLEMQLEEKTSYVDSALTLSILQAVQFRRRQRQLSKFAGVAKLKVENRNRFQEFLWIIDELVAPIAARAEYHFLKWSGRPDLVFTLAYSVTLQYVTTVDKVLQPILDRARLVGYSARDQWISAMVAVVTAHLRSHLLPSLVRKLGEETEVRQAASFWLHIVDLALLFDKRMGNLAVSRAAPLASRLGVETLKADVGLKSISACISVFAERADRLELWADVELNDAQEKLMMELRKENAWLPYRKTDRSLVQDDFRLPISAEMLLSTAWAVINRCHTLPDAEWRLKFVKSVEVPLVKGYLAELRRRCQEAQAITALMEDAAIEKVVTCINAAYYCERKLLEWSEDVFFLELRFVEIFAEREHECEAGLEDSVKLDWEEIREGNFSSLQGSIFDEEIMSLSQFRTDWSDKLVSAIQRGFDASCQDYQRNKKRWQESSSASEVNIAETMKISETGGRILELNVNSTLVDALAILQSRMRTLKASMPETVFMDVWRSLSAMLDQFLFNGVVLGGAKFCEDGGRQFARDTHALFQVFRCLCVRPSAFFPYLSDAVQLLTLPPQDALRLFRIVSSTTSASGGGGADDGESRVVMMRRCGVRFMGAVTAHNVLSRRILPTSLQF